MSQDGGVGAVRGVVSEEDGRMEMTDVSVYNPSEALEIALHEWMSEFFSSKRQLLDYNGPAKDTKSVARAATQDTMEEQYDAGGRGGAMDKNNGMNDDTKDRASSGGSSDMDTTSENIDDSIDSEDLSPPSLLRPNKENASSGSSLFTLRDLRILVDFFYLPHIHGERGCSLLEEFGWLKRHAAYPDVARKLGERGEEEGGGRGGSGDEEGSKRQEVKLKVSPQSDGEEEDREEEGDDGTEDNDELAEVIHVYM